MVFQPSDILFKYSKTNKTILVSNCRKNRAISILEHHNLVEHFNHIFCKDYRENEPKQTNKYQNAISKLGIVPSCVIAFENEDFEIQNAKNAGILNIIKP